LRKDINSWNYISWNPARRSIKKPSDDTTESEAEIDRMVNALYGLTEEEIGIIENGVK